MPNIGDLINYQNIESNPELEALGRMHAEQNRYNPIQMMQNLGKKPLANIPYSAFNPTIADAVNTGANMMPFIGDAIAIEDAKREYGKGNMGMAAFNAATAIPVIGDLASVAKVALPTAAGIGGIMRQMAKRSGDVPVTPFGKQAGVIGYHGSPHKFDKFSMENIGTGEGAQAYGHGLYFAEAPETADAYRVNLSYDPDQMKIGGKQINEYYDSLSRQADATRSNEKAQELYEKAGLVERLMANEPVDSVESWAKNLGMGDWFNKEIKPNFQSYGHMYTVDIPDKYADNFLDWDKPLSSQPKSVQDSLELVRSQVRKSFPEYVDNPDITGQGLYEMLRQHRGGSSDVASEALNESGIKGIRYLDQQSRDIGEGTSNFVVFDDKIIKTLERK